MELIRRTFRIWENDSGEVIAIKKGWCWPAFFFTWFWALAHKMWGLFLTMFAFIFALFLLGAPIVGLVVWLVFILFGAYGNEWRENKVKAKRFYHITEILALNPKEAITLYHKQKENQDEVYQETTINTQN